MDSKSIERVYTGYARVYNRIFGTIFQRSREAAIRDLNVQSGERVLEIGVGTGALAVPLLTPSGCGGVLAIELQHGRERLTAVRSIATILAAMLAQLIASAPPADTVAHVEAAESMHARRHYHQL